MPDLHRSGFRFQTPWILIGDKWESMNTQLTDIQRSGRGCWNRLWVRRRSRVLVGQVKDILRRVDAMPTLDTRSADEIFGYDERGLPR